MRLTVRIGSEVIASDALLNALAATKENSLAHKAAILWEEIRRGLERSLLRSGIIKAVNLCRCESEGGPTPVRNEFESSRRMLCADSNSRHDFQ
jgi:hypothetical protein